MIYITGDTHIPIDIHKLSMKNFPEQRDLTKDDYLIICGDFGGVWDNSPEEKYWINWLNDKSFTTLFVDGNHENFNLLDAYDVLPWNGGYIHKIAESVYHLMRGGIFTIDGIKIFAMGGASSHDKETRIENKSWWAHELPESYEYRYAFLALDSCKWKVDVVISHCAPDKIQSQIADWYEHDMLTNFLQTISLDLEFSAHYFGHYHIDLCLDEKYYAVYNKILKLK